MDAYTTFPGTDTNVDLEEAVRDGLDGLDFVRSSENLGLVENRIRQSLKMPPFQAELPLQMSG